MSRFSVLVAELTMFPEELEMSHYQRLLNTGDYLGEYGFTACHFFLPEDFRTAFANKGVEVSEMAGMEGISSSHR